MRNYCAGYFEEDTGRIHFYIQAEKEVGIKGTKGYLIAVPKLLFGKIGTKLHMQSPLEYLNAIKRPINSNIPPSPPQPSQQPQFPQPQFSQQQFSQQQENLRGFQQSGFAGGFIRPPRFWRSYCQQ